MASADSDRVDLTELDVITRYSLAVRHGTAERSELIEALRADLAWLEGGRSSSRSAGTRSTARKTTARKSTARRSR
jgi:hypothetical protein